MKILVCGGRYFSDQKHVDKVLDMLQPSVLIHGAAKGADSCAADWGKRNPDVETKAFPADWDTHGKSAGPIRNREMLRENPEIVVAFAGGKGTADMVKIAKKASLQVLEV